MRSYRVTKLISFIQGRCLLTWLDDRPLELAPSVVIGLPIALDVLLCQQAQLRVHFYVIIMDTGMVYIDLRQ